MSRIRWSLIAICAALIAANAWFLSNRAKPDDPEFALLFDAEFASECWMPRSSGRIAFERPVTFDANAAQWTAPDGTAVDIAQRIARPPAKAPLWDYPNVRIRFDDQATMSDAITAFTNLAEQGVCRSDWVAFDVTISRYEGETFIDAPGRFDLPMTLREFRAPDAAAKLCVERGAPKPRESDMASLSGLGFIPEARALTLIPPLCLLPDLPQE